MALALTKILKFTAYFFYDLCSLTLFKKYLFGLAVTAYVITTVGIPVYLHYCGGELETINYVLKSDSCCGGEEEDSETNDCCEDEGYVLKSSPDFTTKDLSIKLKNPLLMFFAANLPYLLNRVLHYPQIKMTLTDTGPPRLQSSFKALCVLRI